MKIIMHQVLYLLKREINLKQIRLQEEEAYKEAIKRSQEEASKQREEIRKAEDRLARERREAEEAKERAREEERQAREAEGKLREEKQKQEELRRQARKEEERQRAEALRREQEEAAREREIRRKEREAKEAQEREEAARRAAEPTREEIYGALRIPVGTTDPYQILGVSPYADKATIKRALRELFLEWHPDKPINKDRVPLANEITKVINNAWDVIKARHGW